MGGVGKTAVTLQFANEIKDKYPDAQLYINMYGYSAGQSPKSAYDAMADIIHAFQPDRPIPQTEDQIANDYRSVIYGKRILLIIDNFRAESQVELLIPGDGSLMIVTSRENINVDGIALREIERLSETDAVSLLSKLIPAQKLIDKADNLANKLGYLPIAITNAAPIVNRADITVDEYMRKLGKSATRAKLIDKTFSISYEYLTPEQQQRWRMLSVFPETFEQTGIAAVWGLELSLLNIENAKDTLSDLLNVHMLDYNLASKRYSMHDLLRDFALNLLPEDEAFEAQKRHADYFMNVLHNANLQYLNGGEDLIHALTFFDNEWPNIETGQKWSLKYVNEADTTSVARICLYAVKGANLINIRLSPLTCISWAESALKYAIQRKKEQLQGTLYGNIGVSLCRLGRYAEAVSLFKTAVDIDFKFDDFSDLVSDMTNLATAYSNLGDNKQAIDIYWKMRLLARRRRDYKSRCVIACNLAKSYAVIGKLKQSKKLLSMYAVVSKKNDYIVERAYILSNLGVTKNRLNELRSAENDLEESLKLARKLENKELIGNNLRTLSMIHEQQGRKDIAIKEAEEALPIMEAIQNPCANELLGFLNYMKSAKMKL